MFRSKFYVNLPNKQTHTQVLSQLDYKSRQQMRDAQGLEAIATCLKEATFISKGRCLRHKHAGGCAFAQSVDIVSRPRAVQYQHVFNFTISEEYALQ